MESLSEAQIKYEVRVRLSNLGCVIWNQATGYAESEKVTFGLCRGSSDCIGIAPRGRFLAAEIKTIAGMAAHLQALARAGRKPKGPLTRTERRALEQHLFIELVKRSGGIAGFVTSADQAEELLDTCLSGCYPKE
jgi:hypothetical protein